MKTKDDKIPIAKDEELLRLIDRFRNGRTFAAAFEFGDDSLYNQFFDAIGINLDTFHKKYYYVDKDKGIHISASENGYVWISTMGLVAKSRISENNFINACCSQKTVLIHLLDDSIALCNDESSYDIDSYNYQIIEELTPSLFHNTIFYFETLAKAYLSINGQDVPHTHKLETLLQRVKETMFEKHHNNTMFHAHTIPMFEEIVRHIASISGSFKEQYVKYDENSQDTTLIEFHPDHLKNVRDLVEVTCDMIMQMYYDQDDCFYLGTGLYQRLLKKCDNDEARKRVNRVYGFLI